MTPIRSLLIRSHPRIGSVLALAVRRHCVDGRLFVYTAFVRQAFLFSVVYFYDFISKPIKNSLLENAVTDSAVPEIEFEVFQRTMSFDTDACRQAVFHALGFPTVGEVARMSRHLLTHHCGFQPYVVKEIKECLQGIHPSLSLGMKLPPGVHTRPRRVFCTCKLPRR